MKSKITIMTKTIRSFGKPLDGERKEGKKKCNQQNALSWLLQTAKGHKRVPPKGRKKKKKRKRIKETRKFVIILKAPNFILMKLVYE